MTLHSNGAALQRYQADPEAAMSAAGLSEAQKVAIRSRSPMQIGSAMRAEYSEQEGGTRIVHIIESQSLVMVGVPDIA